MSFSESRCRATAGLMLVFVASASAFSDKPFVIRVVDRENGWPVPLVKLTTTSNVTFITDNAGIVAFDEPNLMGRETWLYVDGDGYEVKPDGFGYQGLRVTPEPGKTVTIKVERNIIARRIGRLTGSGLYAESQKCGMHMDWKDQGITGCDTIRLAPHNGSLHWVWGDTGLPRYPLGLFQALGAKTDLEPLKKFKPPLKLRFDYFRGSDGKPRNTAEMPGPGPTWLDAIVSLPDADGNKRLVCYYVKVKKPMVVYQIGLCVWNEQEERFDKLKELWNQVNANEKQPTGPMGHVTLWKDKDGVEWALFGDPFPFLKCKATFEAWQDPNQWEAIEAPKTLKTFDGDKVHVHRGSIAWNNHRDKWVCVFGQVYGKPSMLGEIWYTESDSPLGPWQPAIKILSHKKYSFYNPRMQPDLTPADADFILFEGTYTQTFSSAPTKTPRYDYNQILYRLNLDDIADKMDSKN